MQLFATMSFFGGALFGGLGLLAYARLPLPCRIEFRLVAGLVCVAVWLAVFFERPYQPVLVFLWLGGLLALRRRAVVPLWLAVTASLAPLVLVKIAALPFLGMLGLSFVTFRAIDVLLFARADERIAPLDYFVYLFFPLTLLAGPMYRWRSFLADLQRGYAGCSMAAWLEGLEAVLLGVVQKFALADLVWRYGLERVDAHDYSIQGIALNAVLYSLFLYLDFAGYSNMAIGVGRMLGFNLPVNFRNPLAAANPQDFWRRWHISLSEWLRDVIFMPIYKALSKTAYFGRHRLAAQNVGIFATLLAMGIWNGLQWNYVASGAMFGVWSMGHNLLVNAARTRPGLHAWLQTRPVQWAGRVLTLVLAALALYVFSGRSPI